MAPVAGDALGAGVLALPAATLRPGFGPSTAALIATWTFCMATGLLVAEAMPNFQTSEKNEEQATLYLVAENTLGPAAGAVSCATRSQLRPPSGVPPYGW